MILTGSKITNEVKSGKITIAPFDESCVNPNSYNVSLGKKLVVYDEKVLDPKKKMKTKEIEIPEEGLILQPDTLYLGHTEETFGSGTYVPIIRGRSSTGRLGIFVNITADLYDIGSINQSTLMMHVVQPVRVYPGMKIAQITFWTTTGSIKLYEGKYQGLSGPQSSKTYMDFEQPKKVLVAKSR